ncbi:MAG: hypothetical protein WDN08_09185 [Rhizomicrobium sp.]
MPTGARKLVDDGLSRLNMMGLKDRALYAVGGIWRSFARVDMEAIEYPAACPAGIRDPAQPGAQALPRAFRAVAQIGREDEGGVQAPRRSLPYGAIVLERLLLACDLRSVVISAYGLREGILYARLAPEERGLDPLLEFAEGYNARQARSPGHAQEMFDWMAPLFGDETAELKRIRRAVCLFSDVAWRRHPDDRAIGSFGQVLTAPFAGADHRARALIATSVHHRYSGDEDFPRDIANADLLNKDDELRSLRIGLACRLAFALSASSTDALPHYKLRATPAKIVLDIPRRDEAIAGEPVQKRLGALAAAFDRKGEIVIG